MLSKINILRRHQTLMVIQFLIHNKGDDVGVATSDIKKGSNAEGVYMDTNERIKINVLEDIPLGHKLALRDLSKDQDLTEYSAVIGRVTETALAGSHVHTHNLRSKRWA